MWALFGEVLQWAALGLAVLASVAFGMKGELGKFLYWFGVVILTLGLVKMKG